MTQSCSLLAAVRSRASQTPTASRTTATINPATAPVRLSPGSGSVFVIAQGFGGHRHRIGPLLAYHRDGRHTRRKSVARVRVRWVSGAAWVRCLQVVRIPADRWHSHSAPSIGFETGFGEATPIVSTTAAQTAAVAMTKKALRLRGEPVIAVTPWLRFARMIGVAPALACERVHMRPICTCGTDRFATSFSLHSGEVDRDLGGFGAGGDVHGSRTRERCCPQRLAPARPDNDNPDQTMKGTRLSR